MSAFNGFTPVSSGFDFFDRNVNNQGNAHNFNNNRNNKINVSFKGKYKHLPPGQQLTRKKDSNKFNGTTNKNTRNNNLDSNNDYNKNYSNSNNKNKYSNNKKWNTYKKNDHNNQNNSPTRGNTPIVNNNNGQLSSSLTKKKKKKKIYFKCLSPDKEKQLGPLTQNIDPLDLGFRKNSSKGNNNVTGTQILREAPKFMLRQQPHYESKPFIQDSWDKLNQEKMIELETKNISDINYLYDIFKKMRESERTTMEKKGLVDKAEVAKDLTEAINFQGTCLDMCPIYERIRRTVENNVASYEKDQNTGLIDRFKAIKVFARPAASAPPPLPSDVRPPHILVKTLDYIVDNLIQCLPDCESFVWDRMRSIRQDFTYQNYCGPEAVNCNERIVRIHLLILHIMSKCDVEYSRQQELEQLQKALITLGEIYDEVGGENEAEFRAYALLSIIRDAEYDRSIQKLSPKIFNNDLVQLAIAFRRIISNSNFYERGYSPGPNGLNLYTQFFKLLNSAQVPFLLSSYLETYINEIRFYGFYFIKQATNKKLKPLPMSYLKNIFSFNSFEEINEFCEYYSIDVVDNGSSVAVHSLKHSSHLIPERKPLNQAWLQSVDLKLTKYTSYSALINSEISSSFAFNANTNFNSFNKFKEENQLLVDTLDDGVERNSNNDVMVKPQSIATTTDLFGNSNNGNRELDKSSTLAGFAPQPPANTTNFNTNIPNINFGTAVESGMITTKNEGIGNDFGFNMDAGNNVPQTGMTPSTNIVPSFNNVLPQFTDSSRDSSQRIDNNTNSNPLFQSIKATNMSTSNILPQLPATSTTFETTSLNGSFPNIGNKGSTLSGKQTDHNDFLDNKDIINIENKKNEKNKLQVEKELEGKKKKKRQGGKEERGGVGREMEMETQLHTIEDEKKMQQKQKIINDVGGEIIDKVCKEQVSKIVEKYVTKFHEREQQMQEIVTGLFESFIHEQIYLIYLDSRATLMNEKFTKKRILEKWLNSFREKSYKRKVLEKKRKEWENVQKQIGIIKKRNITLDNMLNGEKNGHTSTVGNNSSKATAKNIWLTPEHNEKRRYSLSKNLDRHSLYFNKTIDSQQLDLENDYYKVLLATRSKLNLDNVSKYTSSFFNVDIILFSTDWSTVTGKWLTRKFGLGDTVNKPLIYRSSMVNNCIQLRINKIDTTFSNTSTLFENLQLLIFNTGVTDDNIFDLELKLKQDGEKLIELMHKISLQSIYKINILIIYWDSYETQFTSDQLAAFLKVMKILEIFGPLIKSIDVLKMTDSNSSVKLQRGLKELAKDFNFELSGVGETKYRAMRSKKMEEQKTLRKASNLLYFNHFDHNIDDGETSFLVDKNKKIDGTGINSNIIKDNKLTTSVDERMHFMLEQEKLKYNMEKNLSGKNTFKHLRSHILVSPKIVKKKRKISVFLSDSKDRSENSSVKRKYSNDNNHNNSIQRRVFTPTETRNIIGMPNSRFVDITEDGGQVRDSNVIDDDNIVNNNYDMDSSFSTVVKRNPKVEKKIISTPQTVYGNKRISSNNVRIANNLDAIPEARTKFYQTPDMISKQLNRGNIEDTVDTGYVIPLSTGDSSINLSNITFDTVKKGKGDIMSKKYYAKYGNTEDYAGANDSKFFKPQSSNVVGKGKNSNNNNNSFILNKKYTNLLLNDTSSSSLLPPPESPSPEPKKSTKNHSYPASNKHIPANILDLKNLVESVKKNMHKTDNY